MVDLKDEEAGEIDGNSTVLDPEAVPFIPRSLKNSADPSISTQNSEAEVSENAVNISDDNEGKVNECETVDATTEEISTVVMNTTVATEPHNEPSNGSVKCESNGNLDHVENGERQESENNVNETSVEPCDELSNMNAELNLSENVENDARVLEVIEKQEVEQANEGNQRVESQEKSEPQEKENSDSNNTIIKVGENQPVQRIELADSEMQDKLEAPKMVIKLDAALKDSCQEESQPATDQTVKEPLVAEKVDDEPPVNVSKPEEIPNAKLKQQDTGKEAEEPVLKVEEPECNIEISKPIDNSATIGIKCEEPKVIDKELNNESVQENEKLECQEGNEHPEDEKICKPVIFEEDKKVDLNQENIQSEDRLKEKDSLANNKPVDDQEPKVSKEIDHPIETVQENKVEELDVEKKQPIVPKLQESGDILKNPEAPITAPRRSKMLTETKEIENKKRDSYQATKEEIEESLTFIKSKLNSSSPLVNPKNEKETEAAHEGDASAVEIAEPVKCSDTDAADDAPGYEPVEAKGSEPLYESIAQEESNKKEASENIESTNGDGKVEIVSNIVKPGEYSRECIPPVRPERSRKKENLQVPQWTPPKQNIISYLFGCFRPKSE